MKMKQLICALPALQTIMAISLILLSLCRPAAARDIRLTCDATLLSVDLQSRMFSVRVHGIHAHPMRSPIQIPDGVPEQMTVVLSPSANPIPPDIRTGTPVRMWGRFAETGSGVFVAEYVRYRGHGRCMDPTGVRGRLGRGPYGGRRGLAGDRGCMPPFVDSETDAGEATGSDSSGNDSGDGGSGSGSSGGNGSGGNGGGSGNGGNGGNGGGGGGKR